ncbi:hypothetical protein THAOC_35598 [Thalassiosira oceanica]|uniref:Uncharacterized protein n=1 Tax=Thalassiosira oceanica TaxID=159749 RepID=K0RA01_THAOC|nr:hypothetical protein THAOC_35598 [Thalassiosira oceanica]|eukprot:EJK45771.1 hypothetical protein THAOC_35598 [Thalassiosira oceanica]
MLSSVIVPRRTVPRRGGTILARLDLLGAGGPRGGETRPTTARRAMRAGPLATKAARLGAAPRNKGPRRGRPSWADPPVSSSRLSPSISGGAWWGAYGLGGRSIRRMSLARSAVLSVPESTATARVEEGRVPVQAEMMPLSMSSLHAFEQPDDEEARNNQLHNSRGVSNLIHWEGPISEAVNCNASDGANLTRPRHLYRSVASDSSWPLLGELQTIKNPSECFDLSAPLIVQNEAAKPRLAVPELDVVVSIGWKVSSRGEAHGALEVTLDRRTTDAPPEDSNFCVTIATFERSSPSISERSPPHRLHAAVDERPRSTRVSEMHGNSFPCDPSSRSKVPLNRRSTQSASSRTRSAARRHLDTATGAITSKRRHSASIAMSKDRRSSLTRPTRVFKGGRRGPPAPRVGRGGRESSHHGAVQSASDKARDGRRTITFVGGTPTTAGCPTTTSWSDGDGRDGGKFVAGPQRSQQQPGSVTRAKPRPDDTFEAR